jgi:hypothetical protein
MTQEERLREAFIAGCGYFRNEYIAGRGHLHLKDNRTQEEAARRYPDPSAPAPKPPEKRKWICEKCGAILPHKGIGKHWKSIPGGWMWCGPVVPMTTHEGGEK